MNKVNKSLLWANGALVGLVIVFGLLAFRSQNPLGAQSNFSGPINSAAGYQESGTEVIDTSGAWLGVVSSTSAGRLSTLRVGGVNSSIIQEWDCATAAWNPGAVTTSSPDQVDVTATGAALGDVTWGSFSTSTLTLANDTGVSTTDVIWFRLFQPDSDAASVNLAAATATVCWVDPDNV